MKKLKSTKRMLSEKKRNPFTQSERKREREGGKGMSSDFRV